MAGICVGKRAASLQARANRAGIRDVGRQTSQLNVAGYAENGAASPAVRAQGITFQELGRQTITRSLLVPPLGP